MRVLIVDDAHEICWVHERLLRMLGHEAQGVHDGRTTFTEAKKFRPDVILLDICMPNMDGWDVAEQLRADPETRDIRLVAITAMSSPECERRSREAGFDAHYGKPVSLSQWPAILAPQNKSGLSATGLPQT